MTLIERLEALTGPSEEANAHIWNAIYGHDKSWVAQSKFNGKWLTYEKGMRGEDRLVEHNKAGSQLKYDYTASLDAALTLVPDGMKWSSGTWSRNFGTCGEDGNGPAPFRAEGVANPAIALTIAALKARGVK